MCAHCTELGVMSQPEADQIAAAEREQDLATVLSMSAAIARRNERQTFQRAMRQHERYDRRQDEDGC